MAAYILHANRTPQRRQIVREELGFWQIIKRLISGEIPVSDYSVAWHEQWDTWLRECERKKRRAHECVEILNEKRSIIKKKISKIGPLK